VASLSDSFGNERTFKLEEASGLHDVMNHLMPLHFSKREGEYFVYFFLSESSVFVAVNHRFHDARSVGIILQNKSILGDGCVVPSMARKVPPGASPAVRPTNVTSIKIDVETMREIKMQSGMTRNEVAFMVTAVAIARGRAGKAETQSLMCLHSQRKAAGEVVS
jgi:hypothetical protein